LAKIVLVAIGQLLATTIPLEWDGTGSVLAELFDPSQPFYQKYGYPKVRQYIFYLTGTERDEPPMSLQPNQSTDSATTTQPVVAEVKPVVDQQFLDELNMDDVVDYFGASNTWETGTVASFRNNRSEIEILNVQTEKKEWLSLEHDGHRIAPACTKIGESGPDATSPINTIAEVIASASEPAVDGGIVDVAWLSQLGVGNLVDVKNKSGNWYQVKCTKLQFEFLLPNSSCFRLAYWMFGLFPSASQTRL
jgi:hypothetical protein